MNHVINRTGISPDSQFAEEGGVPRVRLLKSLALPASPKYSVGFYRRCEGKVSVRSQIVRWPTRYEQLQLCSIEYNERILPSHRGDWPNKMGVVHDWRHRWLINAALRMSPIRCDTDLFLDLRQLTANNISHVIHDIAPLVLSAEKLTGRKVTLVTYRIAQPFRELLETLGVTVLETPRTVVGTALVWHACRPYTAYEWPWADMPSIVFDPHVYRGASFPCKAQSESIYVGRRGARALSNSAEVQGFLEARGYQTVFMEDYSAAEKLGILSQARRIVAVHGAGLAPASFNFRGIEDVIELMPPHAMNYWFVNTVAPLSQRWAMVMSEFDAGRTRLGWSELVEHKNAPFSVDIELLEAALEGRHGKLNEFPSDT